MFATWKPPVPLTVGMQGQAICEFSVKAKEDHAGKGWRVKDY